VAKHHTESEPKSDARYKSARQMAAKRNASQIWRQFLRALTLATAVLLLNLLMLLLGSELLLPLLLGRAGNILTFL
jgi:fatty acid desaturase